MTRFSSICAVAGATIFATPAFAHHPGGIGNTGSSGGINTISASTLAAGINVASFVYVRIGLDPLSDATLAHAAEDAADHGDRHVHSMDAIASPSLNYAYGLTNDLMLSIRLPFVQRTRIREGHFNDAVMEGEVHDHGSSGGIGDVSTLLHWRFLNNPLSGTQLALLAGVKVPTGATHKMDHDGERFDAEFQPGSGSWDVMAGLALTQNAGAFSIDASLLYTAVGTGVGDTDLGDRLHYGLALSYRLSGSVQSGAANHAHSEGPHDHTDTEIRSSLDAILEFNGEWHEKQETAGEMDDNSGGHTLYVAPGLRLSKHNWSAFASIGIPILSDLNGLQAEPDWRLVSGISFTY